MGGEDGQIGRYDTSLNALKEDVSEMVQMKVRVCTFYDLESVLLQVGFVGPVCGEEERKLRA